MASAPIPPIQGPRDLRTLSIEGLRELAEDMRQSILSACMTQGGHLGASLGTVELAIALHHRFESPAEAVIWDVGHQAYAHKLITGRWDRFPTLRATDGLSGFLSRDESEHDVFGAGHSSTSLSAALAVAWARGKSREDPATAPWTVAVIGDGGLTAGLAFEALNNVRSQPTGPLLAVVNDNQMSIAANVGAVSRMFAEGRASEFFGLFGFDYVGPIDGHDLSLLIGTIDGIRRGYAGRPVVLHVLTQKGKGYPPAEEQPAAFHGISPIQAKVPGKQAAPAARSYSEAFGDALCELAEKDDRVVAITAAMPEGTSLVAFSRRFPDRFFDVGISEPHAVTFAAGLATQGYRPVVAIYSTFLQRALDSIIHDVALQRLPVVFAIDRAGLVGADGPTHHGAFDLAYLGAIPGMRLMSPSCLDDLDRLFGQALSSEGPVAIRYPRGSGPESIEPVPRGEVRWHSVPESPKAIVVAYGSTASKALRAMKEPEVLADVAVISTCLAKPIPAELIEYLDRHRSVPLVTVEEAAARGGFGQALQAELLPRTARVETIGYGDHFVAHGAVADLEEREGVSTRQIRRRLESSLGARSG